MHVGDWVLRELERELAARPPERGGALLGPPGRPLVSRFVADPDARASSASWRPSRELAARVREVEEGEGLELKGLVHSHPRGLDRPSEQDARELAEGLRRNGHLASYLAPIVTAPAPERLAPHELPLPSGKVSFFAGWRAEGGAAEVREVRAAALPLLGDLESAAAALGAGAPEVFLAELAGERVPAGRLVLVGGEELLLLAGDLYPALPPIALLTGPEARATEQLALSWRLQDDPARRLPAALSDALAARRSARELGDALFARSGGILSPALRARGALVAGLGSVGSYVAEQLARSGVGKLALLDPEPVEAANLSRTVYEAADVGRPKVEALARRLRAIQPGIALELHGRAVQELDPAALDAVVSGADLVVAATDDPAAQRALNRFAYSRGRPALFVGIYAGARGGEVVISDPERTPCYLCATRVRHDAERAGGRVAREADYGSGRLAAEPALGADVQHVASAAVKLALSLLSRGGDPLAAFAEGPIADGTPYLTMSTVAGYWFYPRVLGDVAGQGAYQSVWLTPSRRDDCPVCGAAAERVDPRSVPLRGPSRGAFAGLVAGGGADIGEIDGTLPGQKRSEDPEMA